MQRRSLATFGLLFSFLVTTIVGADTPAEVQARLRQDLNFLTSDVCEGRGITTKGIKLAVEHIEREFVKAGLKPGAGKGSYFQSFTVPLNTKIGQKNRLVLTGPLGQTIALDHNTHFSLWPKGGSGKCDAPVVFAGYGVTATDQTYDDYAGLDVAGKVVVILRGTPRESNPPAAAFANVKDDYVSLDARIDNAKRRKAAGVLVLNSRDSSRRLGDILSKNLVLTAQDGDVLSLPTAFMKRDVADAMLGDTTLAQIEGQIDADLKPRSRQLAGWTCALETDVTITSIQVKNIIGIAEGSGPLANETVVVGAHYDHVGYFGTTRKLGDGPLGMFGPGAPGGVGFPMSGMSVSAIHHGADDNASGTSALLELARRFGAMKDRQGRKIVFIAFSAEESGLIGSAHFCRNPTVPFKDITTMVNMDQVGRMQDDKLMAGGLGSAKSFPGILDKLSAKHQLKVSVDPSGEGPSDHMPFYFKKIPVWWFFTGFHEHYHRPTDVVGTLNVPGLGKVVDIVADVVTEVSTMPSRPVWTKTGKFDRTKTLWSSAPSTGIVVDHRASGPGVLVTDLVKFTPAARADLMKGDRITAVHGTKVEDVPAFLQKTRTLKPGDLITLDVLRSGEKRKVDLQLISVPVGFRDWHFGFVTNLTNLKSGIVLTDVSANSPAAKAGLQKGDRITAIAGKNILDMPSYALHLWSLQPGDNVQLTFIRGGKKQQVEVRTNGNSFTATRRLDELGESIRLIGRRWARCP